MFENFKNAMSAAAERRRHRRDYKYLLRSGNQHLLRDIGVDRYEVERLYSETRYF
jgi:uncharacterized protein YjiS (DUF1127 family)